MYKNIKLFLWDFNKKISVFSQALKKTVIIVTINMKSLFFYVKTEGAGK